MGRIFTKTASIDEVDVVAKAIKDVFDRDNINYKKDSIIVFLDGNLSSGKTTLVRSFASLYNLSNVSSPTFGILNNYDNIIYHYDLYIVGVDKFMSLGLINELDNNGIHFIEWGDEVLKSKLNEYGFSYYELKINFDSHDTKQNNKREYIFEQ